MSNHATWVRLLPGSDPTAFSAILRCRIGHTHTDDVLSDRSALTRYRLSADERAPRKPAETDDIACAPLHTQAMTPVRPPDQPAHNSYRSICDICLLVQNPCRRLGVQLSKKPQNHCGMFTREGYCFEYSPKRERSTPHDILHRTSSAFLCRVRCCRQQKSPPRTTPWVSRRQFQTQVTQDEVIRIVRWLDRSG